MNSSEFDVEEFLGQVLKLKDEVHTDKTCLKYVKLENVDDNRHLGNKTASVLVSGAVTGRDDSLHNIYLEEGQEWYDLFEMGYSDFGVENRTVDVCRKCFKNEVSHKIQYDVEKDEFMCRQCYMDEFGHDSRLEYPEEEIRYLDR